MAQVTTVNWADASTASPVCPNQLYQQGGGQGLSVLNPRTVAWDSFAAAPSSSSGTAFNGYAYAPERGVAFATANEGAQNLGSVRIAQVSSDGSVIESAVYTALEPSTARSFANPGGTPATATHTTMGDGAYAAGGYDEARHFFWTIRANSPNVFYVYDMDTVSNPLGSNALAPSQQKVAFANDPATNFAYPRALPTLTGEFPASVMGTGNAGAAQFTDVLVLGNKVYSVSMNSLFVYEFSVDAARTITPTSYRRIRLDNLPGNEFPRVGTFGAQWLAVSPAGKPVIYASLNSGNGFTSTTPPLAGYPGGSLFRIEDIDSAAPVARLETFKSITASGGDGFNCAGADGIWLLEAADDLNYTPVNTAVTGSWIANDNLHAAGLASAPGSLVAVGGSDTKPTTQGGSIVMRQDGSYTYTPAPGFTGKDTYAYTVCDSFAAAGEGKACRTATITIYVDGPQPVVTTVTPATGPLGAAPDRYTTSAGVGFTTTSVTTAPSTSTVLTDLTAPAGNDAYPAGSTFSPTTVLPAGQGAISAYDSSNGGFHYDPQGFAGTTSFDYQVCQPYPPSPAAPVCVSSTVTIVVPGAVNDSYTAAQNAPLLGASVAGNDTAPLAGSTFAATGPLSNPAAGSLVFRADGSFDFTPAAGFSGVVSFPYQLCLPRPDEASCATAVVSISVPGASNDSHTTPSGATLNGNVGSNDAVPPGSSFSQTGPLSNPAAGTLTFNADGSFSFVPAPGFSGSVNFPYRVCLPAPNQAVCVTAVATIVVAAPAVVPANQPWALLLAAGALLALGAGALRRRQ